jgi:hypothetical protein
VGASDVLKQLSEITLDQDYRQGPDFLSPQQNLLESFEGRFGRWAAPWESTCWFHLTRVIASVDFGKGILPLHLALDGIWETLKSIAADSRTRLNLENLRKNGVPNDLYILKTNSRIHSGPFAMLVRESAFCSRPMGNHDYLASSEIVEDICNGLSCFMVNAFTTESLQAHANV